MYKRQDLEVIVVIYDLRFFPDIMLNACRLVMVTHRVLPLRVWQACMNVLAKSSLSRATGAQASQRLE